MKKITSEEFIAQCNSVNEDRMSELRMEFMKYM